MDVSGLVTPSVVLVFELEDDNMVVDSEVITEVPLEVISSLV